MNEQMTTESENKPAPVALANWAKAPTVAELKQDLSDAKPIHNAQVTKVNGYLDNLNIEGAARPKVAKGRSAIQPKLIRKQAEWRYAALSEPFLSTKDLFNVSPVSWEDRNAAKQNQLVLNHQINNRLNKVKFIDEYVRTAVDEGTVIVQTGWEFTEVEEEVEVPDVQFVVNSQFAEMHQFLAQLKEESPSQYATDVPQELKDAHDLAVERGVPIEPRIVGKKMAKRMKTVCNKPTAEIRSVKNVVIDPTAGGDIEKAGFVVVSWEASKAQLKKLGRYKNLDQIQVTNNSILGTPDHEVTSKDTQNFNFKDDARAKFVVWEYWGFRDVDGTGVLKPIVAAWVGDTLIRMEEIPFPDKKLPFIVEQFMPVRGSMYGEPDGALLEDNQKVLGAVMRGMIDILARSANGQMGMRKDMLDATNKRKWQAGEDYEFNGGVDPRQGTFMHTYPEIPSSAQFMVQLHNMEAESMTGVRSFSQGVSGQSLGDVAAAVRGALDAASKRELGILRRLSNGLVSVGRKWISMNAEFLDEAEVVRITNEEFVTVRRDDLAGNFDLELSISTAEEDNNKAEQLAFMLQTVGPNTDYKLVKMILADICRLRKMPDLAKQIEDYEPEPDPVAKAMAELEVAKILAQVAEIEAKTAKLYQEAGLTQAKVGTEAAKARDLNSSADQRDLNFVEQESGVTQERDLQKQGAQAKAQGELAVVQHQLDSQRDDKKLKVDLLKEYIKSKKKNSAAN